ncbi:Uncharacterised protein [BD1-7 clade bacterium]|uniref:Uncharacterized protein n=1 Tax=BD1-7 clade bacterium TaxID=2029982 RepID=A0A5S9Q686_9GAMM|nr:Uncharacterised protein [BD1-7 clade bacterium]
MTYSGWFLLYPRLGRLVLLSLIPVLGLMLAMHSVLQGADIVGLQLAYTTDRFDELIYAMTPAQLEGVRLHLAFDNIYPVFYSLLFSAIVAWGIRALPVLDGFIWLIPFAPIAGMADLIENACMAPYAGNLLEMPAAAIFFMSCAAMVKWQILVMLLLFVVVCAVLRIAKQLGFSANT